MSDDSRQGMCRPAMGYGRSAGEVAPAPRIRGHRQRAAAVVLAVLALGVATASVVEFSSDRTAGAAPVPGKTWYGRATINSLGTVGLGNCSYPSEVYPDALYTAAPLDEYDTAAGCGTYYDVIGPNGKQARTMLVDKCTECEPGHLDMSPETFEATGDRSLGAVEQITYTLVKDPVLSAPIWVRVQPGSTTYWVGFLVMNHGNQLTSVEYLDSAGAWQPLTRTMYNYWHKEDGAGPGPFTLRITDIYQHQVTVDNIALTEGVTQKTEVWMYQGGTPAPSGTVAPVSPSSSSSGPPAACHAQILMQGSWPNGYQATMKVRNDSLGSLQPWKVSFTVPDGVTVTGWNGTFTKSGNTVTVVAPDYAPPMAAGDTIDVGFRADGIAQPSATPISLNGSSCAIGLS